MRLTVKTAFITGGGNGIGRAIAAAMADEGASVMVVGRTVDSLRETVEEITSRNGRAAYARCDVASEQDVTEAVAAAVSNFGPIDVLVNNAGVMGPTAPVPAISLREWEETLAVNLTGPFLCARAVLPSMIERRSGKIINIASIAAHIAYPLRGPYSASKWGLIGLTRTLAQEAGPYNVQVNAISPGPVEGPRIEKVVAERALKLGKSESEVAEFYTNRTALKRFVAQDDVVRVALMLASDEANSITGQTIRVCSGWAL